MLIKLWNIFQKWTFSFILLDETDEEDVQARKRRMAEKAAAGIIEDAEVIIFSYHVQVFCNYLIIFSLLF